MAYYGNAEKSFAYCVTRQAGNALYRGAILCCALLVAGTSAPIRIMPLGDSITEGSGAGGYRAPLWHMLADRGWDCDFVGSLGWSGEAYDDDHEGWSGYTIREIIWLAPEALETQRPDVVLCMIGTNDMFGDAPPDEAVADLDSLIRIIVRSSIRPILLVSSIPPIGWGFDNAALEAYNRGADSLVQQYAADEQQVYFVDVFARMSEDMLFDGVHPDSTGNYCIAQTWFDGLVALEDSLISVSAAKYRSELPERLLPRRRISRMYVDAAGRHTPCESRQPATRIWFAPKEKRLLKSSIRR